MKIKDLRIGSLIESKKFTTIFESGFIKVDFKVLDEIIEYIEDTEQTIDGEWGSCRNLKELIRDKQMPELYDKLITLRNGR